MWYKYCCFLFWFLFVFSCGDGGSYDIIHTFESSFIDLTDGSPEEKLPVETQLTIIFPEYVAGVFFLNAMDASGKPLSLETSRVSGSVFVQIVEMFLSDTDISIFIYNDFNDNGDFDSGFEPMAQRRFQVMKESEPIILRLHWPWSDDATFPRSFIVDYNPNLSEDNYPLLEHLATADGLILDNAVVENCPACVTTIKEIHPQMVLLLYTDPAGIRANELEWSRSQLERDKYEYVHTNTKVVQGTNYSPYVPGRWKGEYVSELQYWIGSYMINLSDGVTVIVPTFFRDWARLHAMYYQTFGIPLDVDGYFLDNMWEDESWLILEEVNDIESLDINYDQLDNELINPSGGYYEIDRSLQRGTEEFLVSMREIFSGIIVGNEGNTFYLDLLQGKFFENAPYNGDWSSTAQLFITCLKEALSDLCVWHTVVEFVDDRVDMEKCLLGVTTATVFGGYWACGNVYNDLDYSMSIPVMGRRLDHVVSLQDDVYLSVFEKGVVLMNGTRRETSIPLFRDFFTEDGMQIAGEITIPVLSGRFLFYSLPE